MIKEVQANPQETTERSEIKICPECGSEMVIRTAKRGKYDGQKFWGCTRFPKSTAIEYFQILRDTLVGDDLPAWKKSGKRKPISTSKFYFFDIGVARFLQNRQGLRAGSPEFGEAFEAYMYHEIRAYCDYQGGGDLAYWRSTSGFEVDFIVNDKTAVEIKAKTNITTQDYKGLRALKEEALLKNYLLVSLENTPRKVDGIQILPWQIFIERLWQGAYV